MDVALTQSTMIAARLDRLPLRGYALKLVLLLSLGGVFEFYDLFFTGYVAPGLIKSGVMAPGKTGLFGLPGVPGFVFFSFLGLFVGTLVFGFVADRFGRRTIFTWSLVWYSLFNAILAFQQDAASIQFWRFVSSIGIGVELVTIDGYLSELVSRSARGRAFAINQFICYCTIPVLALIAYLLVPLKPFGFDGWRWTVLIGAAGALFVWFLRRDLPESPRWLANHGHLAEAERITAEIEARVVASTGTALPPPVPSGEDHAGVGRFAEIFAPPYSGRTLMLSAYNFLQTIGYYGFQAWLPLLLIHKGIHVTASLQYAFIIALANPVGPLIGTFFADAMERKWQICCAAAGMVVAVILFAAASSPATLIATGVLFVLFGNWLSFSFHNYQAELFPTRVRVRAIGFVYSWSRVSAAMAGLLTGFLLAHSGVTAIAVLIAVAMGLVIGVIGIFGPVTRGLALEAISH